MNLDSAITWIGMGLAASVLAALAHKRVFRRLPVFSFYLCFYTASGLAGLLVYRGIPSAYLLFVLLDVALGFLLVFLAFAELGKNLLLFNYEPLSHGHIAVLLFVSAAAVIFSLSRWAPAPSQSAFQGTYFLAMRAVELLQFAGFLALISWSNLRKLRWPDRELRVATGFGFSTFAWFLVSLLHSHWKTGPIYHQLDQAGEVADLLILAYWLHYFWMEAERELPLPPADAEWEHSRKENEPECTTRLASAKP